MSFPSSTRRQSFPTVNGIRFSRRLSVLFLLLCWSALPRQSGGSISSSIWTHPGEEKKSRRPLHWLQHHWPNLFGHLTETTKETKRKGTSTESTYSHQSTDSADLTKRRLLYHNSLHRHVSEAWTETSNSSAMAYGIYSRLPDDTFPPFPPSMRHKALEQIRHMFYHAYDGYFWNAWPHGELLPGSCRGTNFSLIKLPALTAIDALDTFWVLGNTTEMVRITERLRKLQQSSGTSLWDVNENISVFETTIRVLGGLLSAHQILIEESKIWIHDIWDPVTDEVLDGRSISKQHHRHDDPSSASCPAPSPLVCAEGWPGCLDGKVPTSTESSCEATNTTRRSPTAAPYEYDGFLLRLAIDIADRMIPAFDTDTGIPYGTVNLQSGVPPGETPVASLAGAGTLVLEWELLSRLTGNPIYGQAARLAARALWMRQTNLRLVGKHIDTQNGAWVETLSGMGSNSDSFIEYLVKYCFLFLDGKGADSDFRSLWPAIYQGVYEHMRRGDWYADTDSQVPSSGRSVLESLMAFYPGLQVWLGELGPAARSLNAFFLVREHLGFLPERFSFNHWRADGPKYPLRPELFESNYFMHKVVEKIAVSSPFCNQSRHSGWLWAASWSVDKLVQLQTSCGYASLNKVDPVSTGSVGQSSSQWKAEDDMPSFFLSETLKYLYLTFDEDNPMHTDDNRQWMFTTEAHPIHLPVDDSDEGFIDDLRRLEGLLVRRINHKKIPSDSGRIASDRWTEDTSFKEFLSSLWPIELEMKREQINRPHGAFFFDQRKLLEPRTSVSTVIRDEWNEIELYKNLAHLKFSANGVGDGFSLRSACPNYFASDLLWIYALHGESLDFTLEFISAKDEHSRAKVSTSGVAYGSADALDLLGMNFNPGHREKVEGCSLRALTPKRDSVKKATSDQDDEVFEFQSELGNFQITAFKDGTGFAVERIEDEQTVTASFMHSFDDAQQGVAYIMVRSENQNEAGTAVIMADFFGNSFECAVSLLRVPRDDDFSAEGVIGEEILRVPCTPAMFGPAHITNLIESQGTAISAPIHMPSISDVVGCENPAHDRTRNAWIPKRSFEILGESSVCLSTSIQIVTRGVCSFMTKALNQKEGQDADGMIVINSQDELFTMAGDPEWDPLDPNTTPLSVMVSKDAGQALLSGIKRFSDAESRVLGRINLDTQPKPDELEKLSGMGSPFRFPIVHATESLIQIYAEGYWGIRAVAVNNNWSLQLVRHKLG